MPDEACNFVDDDCDGDVDEGVLTECGDCSSSCQSSCAGVDCATPLQAGEGTFVQEDGALVSVPLYAPATDLWVLTVGRVLRVDTPTRTVIGSYELGPLPANPAAVVVDSFGTAFVLVSERAAPTAVLAVRATDCPDQDRRDGVTTSTSEEALPYGLDECVVWRTELETCDGQCSRSRAMALTAAGDQLWVALDMSGELVELDSETGERTGRAVRAGEITAMADDGRGHLWLCARNGGVFRADTEDPGWWEEEVFLDARATAIDVAADGTIFTGDPLTRIEADDLSTTVSVVPALSLAIDGEGDVWSADERLTELHQSSAGLDIDEAVATEGRPTSVAVDRSGDIWVTTTEPVGLSLIDQRTGEVLSSELAGCTGCLGESVSLRGDVTGMRFERTFGALWARGEATAVFERDCTYGEVLRFLDVEVSTGRARAFVRSAAAPDALDDATWVDLGIFPQDAPAPIEGDYFGDEVVGAFHEVRLQVLEHPTRVARVTLFGSCVPGF